MPCRAGAGSSGLNVHAPAIYNEVTCWTKQNVTTKPDSGCAGQPGVDTVLHDVFGVDYSDPAMTRDGFNFLALHLGPVRGMVLAHPEMALRPWPACKTNCLP